MIKKVICLCLISFSMLSQNIGKVAIEILKLQSENVVFTKFSFLERNNNYIGEAYKKVADSATIVTLDTAKINFILAENKDFIEVSIPYNGAKIDVQL